MEPESSDRDDGNVQDETEDSDEGGITYSISWYGADYPVELLVSRMDTESFYIPTFQRKYVWTIKQASRFIESLLLGLPIPSVFVAKDPDGPGHMVIDGQQRLRTLQYFYSKIWQNKVFKLQDVDPRWKGKSFDDLTADDQQRLNDTIIPTIVFKQDSPENDNTSIYHVFERLNTGGTKLTPQEVRNCVDSGPFIEFLVEENEQNSDWREVFGPIDKRSKDQELILRFFALYYEYGQYKRPMKDFLNKFSKKNRKAPSNTIEEYRVLFKETISFVRKGLGKRAFRPTTGLNAAVFDAVMVAVARNRSSGKLTSCVGLFEKYLSLLGNKDFMASYLVSTADESNVKSRIDIALKVLVD